MEGTKDEKGALKETEDAFPINGKMVRVPDWNQQKTEKKTRREDFEA